MHLSELTTVEAHAALGRSDAVGLLPLGAIEAHGPHLPLNTDGLLSLELCERVAAALPLGIAPIILPPIMLTVTNYAAGFAGTISLRTDTAAAVLADVLDSLGRHGLPRVALVNNHLEPAHIQIVENAVAAGRKLPRVLFVNHCRKPWALQLGDEFKSGDCHAGSYETSLLLASRYAKQVRIDVAMTLPAAPHGLVSKMRAGMTSFEQMGAAEAYFGNPAASTAEEGERLWKPLRDMWLACIVHDGSA